MTSSTQIRAAGRNGGSSRAPGAAEPNVVALIRNNGVAKRAAIAAFVIGSALTAINQAEAVFGEAPLDLPRLALMYVTPFIVVTISQVLAIRVLFREVASGLLGDRQDGPLYRTALSHGIPARALLVAFAVGTVLTAIMAGLALIEGGGFGDVATAQIAQVYALPLIFGVISQSISYRRAAMRSGQGAHESFLPNV